MDGKCGICGDAYDADPRPHEAPGGQYATGTIAAKYQPGSWVDVEIEVTAQHKGVWIFKICPTTTTSIKIQNKTASIMGNNNNIGDRLQFGEFCLSFLDMVNWRLVLGELNTRLPRGQKATSIFK